MKNFLNVFLLLLISARIIFAGEPEISDKLTLKWTTDAVFDTPESVCFDALQDVFYVSNVGGSSPWAKDGVGFISRIDKNGKVIDLKWCDGIDAPKGMAVASKRLFVANIDEVVVISTASGEILDRIVIDNAKALNDITVDDKGVIYVSDSEGKAVYKIMNGKAKGLYQDESNTRPNGLLFANGKLLLATGSDIISIDRETGTSELFLALTGPVDGIGQVSEKEFIYSHWVGAVFLHELSKSQQQIISYPDDKRNSADILFNAKERLLYIPTFFSNTVECYQLKKD